MSVRISHCSTSLENYYLCLKHEVDGFVNRGPQAGDLIYLVVKVGKKSWCGARFTLDEPTDFKPWPDADSYVSAFSVKGIEYCEPFDITILGVAGGKYWPLKYVQGSKPIKDESAIQILDQEFQSRKSEKLIPFDEEVTPACKLPVKLRDLEV